MCWIFEKNRRGEEDMLYIWLFVICLVLAWGCFLELYEYHVYNNGNTPKNLFDQKNISEFAELRKKQNLVRAKIILVAILLILGLGLAKYYFPGLSW